MKKYLTLIIILSIIYWVGVWLTGIPFVRSDALAQFYFGWIVTISTFILLIMNK